MTGTAVRAEGQPEGQPGGRQSRGDRWAERAVARAVWTGGRWWLPGTVAALVAALVGWLVVVAGTAFVAAGCGERGAKFECLGAGLLAVAIAPVLLPLLLWLLYRTVGVRRPVLAVPVTAVVGLCLLAAPELVTEVRLLGGTERGSEPPPASTVGMLIGLAVLGGGLALQGPRRIVRAVAGAVALALLAGSTLALADPAERSATVLRLEGATVPLLLPDDGWQPASVYVDDDGNLSYYAVPVGWEGLGFEGLDVDVSQDRGRFGETCGFRTCTDEGDVRMEVLEPGEPGGPTAWRVVDEVLVTVTTDDDGPAVEPVAFLRGMAPVTVEEAVRREHRD